MNNKIKFFKNKELELNAKLTLQKDCKFGISKGAEKLIDIKQGMFCKFGRRDNGDLFSQFERKKTSDECFKISKAGDYFYIKVKNLLGELGLRYEKGKTKIFDLEKTDTEGLFRLIYREIKK